MTYVEFVFSSVLRSTFFAVTPFRTNTGYAVSKHFQTHLPRYLHIYGKKKQCKPSTLHPEHMVPPDREQHPKRCVLDPSQLNEPSIFRLSRVLEISNLFRCAD